MRSTDLMDPDLADSDSENLGAKYGWACAHHGLAGSTLSMRVVAAHRQLLLV